MGSFFWSSFSLFRLSENAAFREGAVAVQCLSLHNALTNTQGQNFYENSGNCL